MFIENSDKFRNEESGAEVEFRIKADCASMEDVQRALGFMAGKSRRFYLDTAEKFKGDRFDYAQPSDERLASGHNRKCYNRSCSKISG